MVLYASPFIVTQPSLRKTQRDIKSRYLSVHRPGSFSSWQPWAGDAGSMHGERIGQAGIRREEGGLTVGLDPCL